MTNVIARKATTLARIGARFARAPLTTSRRAIHYLTANGVNAVWHVLDDEFRRRPACRNAQPMIDTRWRAAADSLARPPYFSGRIERPHPGRILLAVSSLSSGGAERQMLNTAIGLKARGCDVHLIPEHLHDQPGNSFFLPQARAHLGAVDELPSEDRLSDPWLAAHPEMARVLGSYVVNRILNAADAIAKIAPETVQASLDWTNVTFGIAALMAGVPRIIVSGRNMTPKHFEFFAWFLYPAYKILAAQPNVLFTNNSQAGADDYADWLGMEKQRITVVRNAVDIEKFTPPTPQERARARAALGVADDAAIIAGAFRMSAEKRPFLWLEAAAQIRQRLPNAQFLLFGDGPMRDVVQARAAALGFGDSFHYTGVNNDLRTAFAPADLVMLASQQEGTPNVLIEAQAMGLPVVTTPAFGAAEAVHDGATGRVVRDESAHGIAVAAVALLQDAAFRERAHAEGPLWAETRFGMKRMIDDTLASHAAIGARR